MLVVDGHEMLRVVSVSVSSGFEFPDLPRYASILYWVSTKQRQMLCYQSKLSFSDAGIRPESCSHSLCFHSNFCLHIGHSPFDESC